MNAKVIDVSSEILQGNEKCQCITYLYKLFFFLLTRLFYYYYQLKEQGYQRSEIFCTGAYTPLTREGNIIVDEVLASCYASPVDHDLAHFVTAPIRWFPDIIQMIFGEDEGFSAFMRINEELGIWILPFGHLW